MTCKELVLQRYPEAYAVINPDGICQIFSGGKIFRVLGSGHGEAGAWIDAGAALEYQLRLEQEAINFLKKAQPMKRFYILALNEHDVFTATYGPYEASIEAIEAAKTFAERQKLGSYRILEATHEVKQCRVQVTELR